VSTGDERIHVWDLRAIRRKLAERDLDWNLPAYGPPKESDSPSAPLRVVVDRTSVEEQDPRLYEQQLRKSIAEWTKDIQADPRSVDLLVKRAFAYFQLGEFVEARADLEKALELDPQNPMACNNLAWIYLKGPADLRDSEKGLALAQRAVRLNPDQRELHNNLGVAYYRLRQWDGAIAALEQAARLNKDEARAFELFFLAMSYHEQGDKTKARDSYDQALEWFKSNKASLPPHQVRDLKAYRTEAESVLGIVPANGDPN
jgi:tetratricopeptide (TPR) repeat protein